MAVDREFEAHLKDLFEPVGSINFRRMFGGIGIFRHGLMFALSTSENRLALKADDQTIPDFKAAGCEEWMPQQPGRKPISMGYWYAPEVLLEDPEELQAWAAKAFDAAARIDQAKPPSQRKLKL